MAQRKKTGIAEYLHNSANTYRKKIRATRSAAYRRYAVALSTLHPQGTKNVYNQPTRPSQVLVSCGGGRPTPEPPGCTPSLLLTPPSVVHSLRQLLLRSESWWALSKPGRSDASLSAGGSDDESLATSPTPPPASVILEQSHHFGSRTPEVPHTSGVFFPPISSAILSLRKVKS